MTEQNIRKYTDNTHITGHIAGKLWEYDLVIITFVWTVFDLFVKHFVLLITSRFYSELLHLYFFQLTVLRCILVFSLQTSSDCKEASTSLPSNVVYLLEAKVQYWSIS